MIYKNIIWVEDFDENSNDVLVDDLDALENQTKIDRTKSIHEVFTHKYGDYVEVIEDFQGALDFFDSKFGDFDCVVLDVNLKKTMKLNNDGITSLIDRLKQEGISFSSNHEQLKENAGYYLYLYLLCKGFPRDRVFIRTAYKDTLSSKWNEKFNNAGLIPPVTIDKTSSSENYFVKEIDKLYDSGNQYYAVRKIIFDACNHWIDICESVKENISSTENIIFNSVIKYKNKNISFENIKDMLYEIKTLCSLTRPKNESTLYIQLLKVLSIPFEADINYKLLNDVVNANAIPYFNIMKLFRNWNAHNKFTAEPTDKEFLVLFMIALRSYFDNKDKIIANLRYENAALLLIKEDFLNDMPAWDRSRIKKKIFNFYSSTYKKSGKEFSERYYSMLEDLGRTKGKNCTYKHLIELLWTLKFSPTFEFEIIQKIGFDIKIPLEENILIDILKVDFQS